MAVNVYKKLGVKITKLRKQLKLSQYDLAELAHMDRSYLNEVESGKANPSLKTISKIARALKVKTSDLIDS